MKPKIQKINSAIKPWSQFHICHVHETFVFPYSLLDETLTCLVTHGSLAWKRWTLHGCRGNSWVSLAILKAMKSWRFTVSNFVYCSKCNIKLLRWWWWWGGGGLTPAAYLNKFLSSISTTDFIFYNCLSSLNTKHIKKFQ